MQLNAYFDEKVRREAFPVTAERIFMAHAGVAALPKAAVDAMNNCVRRGAADAQENAWTARIVAESRQTAANLIGAQSDEIALLGPTALGISLIANGFDWKAGDEVVYYPDDYPANVYPWTNLTRIGVRPVPLQPQHPGAITWDLVESNLTPRTRLVALASCGFLNGYRIDVDTIGRNLQSRDIRFCLDAIQTLGAFPTSVKHVDFLSADSHKWLLGPATAGIVFVKKSRFAELRPTLLGSWNVVSPNYVAQDAIAFPDTALRYEPGMLNLVGIAGMLASMKLLMEIGIENIAARLLELRRQFLERLRPLGYRLYLEEWDQSTAASDAARSAIVSVTHSHRDMAAVGRYLSENNVRISPRQNRAGKQFVRFSPHFYNTESEIDRIAALLSAFRA